MTSSQPDNETAATRLPAAEVRMLSFDLDERVEIARLLTGAGHAVRNELASNLDRFTQRVRDDEWDVIFVDARSFSESVPPAVEIIREHAPDVPVFALVESH